MKTGRRVDARDRDLPPVGRIRKRPSMLSEFHGKHYNHREAERDGPDGSYMYIRPYNRYTSSYDQPTMGTAKYDRYGQCVRKLEADSRRHPYFHYHPSPRSTTYGHHQLPSHPYGEVYNEPSSPVYNEDGLPAKRRRLYVDVGRRASASTFDALNSAESSVTSPLRSSLAPNALRAIDSPSRNRSSPQDAASGLSAYLEDIDSEDEALLREGEEEEESKLSVLSPTPASSSAVGGAGGTTGKPTKEELLQMMERVDRDIAATEAQIAVLQRKQAELEESSKSSLAAASISPAPPSVQPSPKTPTPPLPPTEETSPVPSPKEEPRFSPKRSLADTIYTENRVKARASLSALASLLPPSQAITPLYFQPSESPGYHDIIRRHREFRPRLIEYIREQKLDKHKQEVQLCKQYDSLVIDWERRLERAQSNSKKKARDAKSRELFERVFPELKTRREQQERFTRVDQRGIGVVRSDAELKELMYELYEQEEASVRYRRTHASIPPMLTHQKDLKVRFHSSNGQISDPMAVYRESKLANVWTDEEKRIFREKFVMFPKNFEMIASFLPNKSTADCVKYYYVHKKNDNFKQLVRKATFKRRKFIKPQELSLSSTPLLTSPPPLLPEDVKPKPKLMAPAPGTNEGAEPLATTAVERRDKDMAAEEEGVASSPYGDWTRDEIASLKEGLRKYGRAWGKIYREVGGRKTATQCKQFYDELCTVEELGLQKALAEHSIMKNAEKARRKAKNRKPAVTESKKKAQKTKHKPSVPMEEDDSENTESASETESVSGEESESESTITDSSPEDAPPPQQPQKVQRGKKVIQNTSITTAASRKSSEDALDLFISAAEALNNIVPPEIALHDHAYSLPPRALMSGVDLQGSSGLSLIAAAAAVVSPSLSRSAGGKLPSLSPVRAPRGRPPNSQRRGGGSSTSKLSPTLLSPAGSSSYVPLTDMKPVAFRSRTRSAPTDRPRSATITVPRSTSNLSRISLSSSSKVRSVLPTSLPSRSRDSSPSTSSLSLKSMIASQPQQASSTGASGGSVTAAFEALVNVAVAAPPAELHTPRTTAPATSRSATGSSAVQRPNSKGGRTVNAGRSTPSTPTVVPPQHHPQAPVHTQAKDGSTANSSSQILDAINILASLAQAPPSTSSSSSSPSSQSTVAVLSTQPLFVQSPGLPTSNLLGTIMTQSCNPSQSSQQRAQASSTSGGTNGGKAASTVSSSAMSSTVTASVNSLLEHLTGSVGFSAQPGSITPVAKSSSTSASLSSSSSSPVVSQLGSAVTTASSQLAPTLPKADEVSGVVLSRSSGISESTHSVPPQVTASDELSNLNLLSTLVAVLTPTSSPPPPPTAPSPVTVTTATTAKPSSETSTLAQSSNLAPVRHTLIGTSTPPTSKGKALMVEATVSEAAKPAVSSSVVPKRPSSVDLPLPVRSKGSVNTQPFDSPEHEIDSLPRSVVRTNPQVHLQHPTASNSIASSLASIIPPSSMSTYSSISQQSTVLLYTRSLSFPLATSKEPSPDEEDHLESATRGISELSKLLGTGSATDSPNIASESSSTRENSLDFKASWKPADVSNSSGLGYSGSRVPVGTGSTKHLHSHHGHGSEGSGKSVFSSGRTEVTADGTKPFLSSLLESRGTVHKAAAVGTSTTANSGKTNSNNSNDISILDLERHSR